MASFAIPCTVEDAICSISSRQQRFIRTALDEGKPRAEALLERACCLGLPFVGDCGIKQNSEALRPAQRKGDIGNPRALQCVKTVAA